MGRDRCDVARAVAVGVVAVVAVFGAAVVTAGPARADDVRAEVEAMVSDPAASLGPARSYSERLADRLTVLGDTIDGHLGALTLDAVKLRVDGRARRAELRLIGETRYLSLKVDGQVHFRGGVAEVDATIDLSLAGHALRLELPRFEVLPRSYLGERYVEVRVPLVRGSF